MDRMDFTPPVPGHVEKESDAVLEGESTVLRNVLLAAPVGLLHADRTRPIRQQKACQHEPFALGIGGTLVGQSNTRASRKSSGKTTVTSLRSELPMRAFARVSGAIILATAILPATFTAQEIAFTNARIVDPARRTITNGSIIVRDGRIIEVTQTMQGGFAGTRVDLGGRFVIPGLVDMHTHSIGNVAPGIAPQFAGSEVVSRWYLYAGVMAFVDLFNAEDYILGLRDQRRRDGGVGAEIFASGPCLTATDGHCSEYGVPTRIVNNPEEARREIDALAPKRPDVVKIVYDNARYRANARPTVDRITLEAVIANAKRHGLKTVVHVGTWDDVRDAVMAGAAAVTHTPNSAPVPADLAALMVQRGTAHIPTLAVHGDLSRIVEDRSFLDDPLLVAITSEGLRNGYRTLSDTAPALRGFLEWQRSGARMVSASVGTLASAGVVMLTGTDAGNPGVFQGYSVHRELELLVGAGLAPWDALRAATTNAAAFLDRRWGLGQDDEATFVVLEASPIDDIRNTRRIHSVVQRGTVVDRATLLSNR